MLRTILQELVGDVRARYISCLTSRKWAARITYIATHPEQVTGEQVFTMYTISTCLTRGQYVDKEQNTPFTLFNWNLTRVYYKFNTSLVRASLDHHVLNTCLSRAQLNRAELVTCSGRADVSALRDIKITSTTYTSC